MWVTKRTARREEAGRDSEPQTEAQTEKLQIRVAASHGQGNAELVENRVRQYEWENMTSDGI